MFQARTGPDRSSISRWLPITLTVAAVMACGTVFAANNPVPYVDLPVVPSATVPGGSGFTLTVNGAGFVNGSVVNWNGSPRTTTFVSAGQVTAAILASDIATASTASVTVSNPAPGGGTSNVAYFEVTSPASDVVVTGLSLDGFGNVYFLTAADFNHDGKLDLILFSTTFVNYMNVFHIAVALGNGDGTFQPEVFSQNVTLASPGPGTVTEPTITLTGANAGDFSEVNTCTSELLPGASCQVTVKFSPTTVGSRSASLNFSDNASGSPQKVALTGSGPDFSTSSPTPASLTVAAGQTANYTFEISPLGGFSQTVTLTCSGAPAGAKCTVPGSLMLSSGMTVAVSVTTTASGAATKQDPLSSSGRWLASGLFALPLIVSLAGVGVGRRRARVHRWVLLLLAMAAMSLVSACGGGSGGSGAATPPGTYVLTVAGKYTTGETTLVHDTTFTLIVE
jgi:hypothetical protein